MTFIQIGIEAPVHAIRLATLGSNKLKSHRAMLRFVVPLFLTNTVVCWATTWSSYECDAGVL